MDRRDSLKSILVGSVASGLMVSGANLEAAEKAQEQLPGYGRNEKEKLHDQKILAEKFLNEHELATITVLVDLILPANANFGSASEAGVPDFIEFIVKDMPHYQMPVRGGLAWIDNRAKDLYGKLFKELDVKEQKAICDSIAYPGKTEADLLAGEKFFTTMRNLTMTGYYTSEMGIKDLGYKGNTPGVWDGIPEDVLKQQGMSYDPEWIARCVDQSKRTVIAEWDADGNLLT